MSDERIEEVVAVPDQVRRQAQRAEELQREFVAGIQPPGDADGAAAPREAVSPAGDTTVVEPGGGPPSEPAAVDHSAAPPQPSSAGGDWEQRYRTLQGKYDTEIGHLRATVAGLERLVATMHHAPPPPAPAAPAAPAGPITFEQGDIDLYGQDFLEAAARAASARYEPVIANLREQIRRLEGGQHNLNSQNLQDRVFDQLDKEPDLQGWRELNTDPRFINWLQEIDEYAGVPRNVMLQHAYTNGDAIRTGRFFKRYMAEHTVPQPRPTPQTGYTPRPNGSGNGTSASAGGIRLEDMVVPGRAAGSGSGNGAPTTRIWSRPEITRFYRDRTDGKFRGREAEGDALERDILAAASEGRIQ